MSEIVKISGFEICDEYARNQIGILKNRKFIFIGDSYGAGSDGGDGLTLTTWTSLIKEYLNIADENYYTNSVGYAGFLNGTSKFLDILKTFDNIPNKETITDIVVCGGYNDKYYNQADIEVAIGEFADYVKANYPNATFRLGCIGWHNGQYGSHTIASDVIPAYKNVVKYGGCYLNNIEYTMHLYSSFCSDGVHPNQQGNNNIAKHLANALLTGSADVNYHNVALDVVTCDKTGGAVTMNANVIRSSLNNNIARIWCRQWAVATFTSMTFTENQPYTLFKLGKNCCVSGETNIDGDDYYNNVISTEIFLKVNGALTRYPALLYLHNDTNNDTYIGFRILGTGATINNVTAVNIPPFSFVADSLHA